MEPRGIDARQRRPEHPLAGRLADVVASPEQLLVESLACAQADEVDGDVACGGVREPPGDVQDAHRWAQVQPEDAVRVRERAGHDREAGGLAPGHQVARRPRVRDRHRAAALDLPAEEGQDASRRVDHVAEANRRVALVRRPRRSTRQLPSSARGCSSARTALSVENRTKRSTPTSTSSRHDGLRPEDVRGDGFDRDAPRAAAPACTRRRGTPTCGTVALEHLDHAGGASDVGENRHRAREAVFVPERRRELEQRRFSLVDEDELADAQPRQPRAELGADRPTGARDEDGRLRRGNPRDSPSLTSTTDRAEQAPRARRPR